MKHYISDEEFKKGITMFNSGISFIKIAKELNKDLKFISRYFNKNGFKRAFNKIKFTNCFQCGKEIKKNIRKENGKFHKRNKFCNDECKNIFKKENKHKRNKHYNWSEIQKFYDDGGSWREISEKYNVTSNSILKAKQRGDLKTYRSVSDGVRLAVMKGRWKCVHTEEFKEELSISQSLKNRGGKCKWFNVGGQKVQGTWEKNIAEYFTKRNIEWIKLKIKKDIWKYTMNNKIRSYTPDFYLPYFNIYLEIKGYWWGRDKEKMELVIQQNPDKKIIIIEKNKYKMILDGRLEEVIAGFA